MSYVRILMLLALFLVNFDSFGPFLVNFLHFSPFSPISPHFPPFHPISPHFTHFFPFSPQIPGLTCHLWSQNNTTCYLHDSHDYGNYVNILSATLTGIGALLELIMIFFVKDLEIYGDTSGDRVVEMQIFSRGDAAPGRHGENSLSHLHHIKALTSHLLSFFLFSSSRARSRSTSTPNKRWSTISTAPYNP